MRCTVMCRAKNYNRRLFWPRRNPATGCIELCMCVFIPSAGSSKLSVLSLSKRVTISSCVNSSPCCWTIIIFSIKSLTSFTASDHCAQTHQRDLPEQNKLNILFYLWSIHQSHFNTSCWFLALSRAQQDSVAEHIWRDSSADCSGSGRTPQPKTNEAREWAWLINTIAWISSARDHRASAPGQTNSCEYRRFFLRTSFFINKWQ